MHLPLRDGSPPDPPRPKARSADGYLERRRERGPAADGLLPPRPALAWLAVAAAVVSTTLAAFSLLTPCGGLQTSVLAILQSMFGEAIGVGNTGADAGFAASGMTVRPMPHACMVSNCTKGDQYYCFSAVQLLMLSLCTTGATCCYAHTRRVAMPVWRAAGEVARPRR